MVSRTSTGKANSIALSVSYLLVLSVAVRAFIWFPEDLNVLLILHSMLLIAIAGERLLGAGRILWRTLILLAQMGIMIALFTVGTGSDFWAVILLPACIIVMQIHTTTVGWILIGVFGATMSAMQVIGQEWGDGFASAVLYLAAYAFVASYSLLLKSSQTQKARSDG